MRHEIRLQEVTRKAHGDSVNYVHGPAWRQGGRKRFTLYPFAAPFVTLGKTGDRRRFDVRGYSWRKSAFAVGLSVAVMLTWLAYRQFHPYDRIRVFLPNLPADTRFACLVSEKQGQLQAMLWSPAMLVPFTMHPADCAWSFHELRKAPKIDWLAYVQWEFGERYGVVTRSTAGVWEVTWFQPGQPAITDRHAILGGGQATFDLSEGSAELLSAERLNQLGLAAVLAATTKVDGIGTNQKVP